jgi:hypothetical protein
LVESVLAKAEGRPLITGPANGRHHGQSKWAQGEL